MKTRCSLCLGAGTINATPCPKCKGRGFLTDLELAAYKATLMDLSEPEPEEYEPKEESGAWFEEKIEDYGPEAGKSRYVVYGSTNDDWDRGYPTAYGSWTLTFETLKEALKHTGVSRTGISGVDVRIYLNGELLTKLPESEEK